MQNLKLHCNRHIITKYYARPQCCNEGCFFSLSEQSDLKPVPVALLIENTILPSFSMWVPLPNNSWRTVYTVKSTEMPWIPKHWMSHRIIFHISFYPHTVQSFLNSHPVQSERAGANTIRRGSDGRVSHGQQQWRGQSGGVHLQRESPPPLRLY